MSETLGSKHNVLTSNGTITILTPLSKTALADSGSMSMLNSAAGEMLPIPCIALSDVVRV
jgi:hypothetical protein